MEAPPDLDHLRRYYAELQAELTEAHDVARSKYNSSGRTCYMIQQQIRQVGKAIRDAEASAT